MAVCAATVQSGTRYEPFFFPKKASNSVNKTVRAVSKHKQGLHIFQIFQLINKKFTHILRDRFIFDTTDAVPMSICCNQDR